MLLGDKIKTIRTNILKESQDEFCININKYIKEHFSKDEINQEKLLFFQSMISKIENEEIITSKKLIIVLNYLYSKFRINPNWVIINNNNSVSMYTTKIDIDTSLLDLYNNIEINANELLKSVSDINIIIQNSVQ